MLDNLPSKNSGGVAISDMEEIRPEIHTNVRQLMVCETGFGGFFHPEKESLLCLNEKTGLYHSVEVDKLYLEYVNGGVKSIPQAVIGHFEFRQKILLEALRRFSSGDDFELRKWFRAQYQNGLMKTMMSEFLVDTIRFIKTGQRRFSVMMWLEIVFNPSEGETIKETIPKEIRSYFGDDRENDLGDFGTESTNSCYMNHNVTDLLVEWTSHPSGFSDLLVTLKILFGSRPVL